MEKRYGLESDFIVNGDKSVSAVSAWARALFSKGVAKRFKLSKDALEWFLGEAIKGYGKADSDGKKRRILGKIIHTREVVKAGFDIAMAERNYKWNEYQLGTVCLLHDVARFEQALLGSFSDETTDFDHGLEGSKMIENHDFADFENLHIDKRSVVESVFNHNKFGYSGNDKYAKLTRDADKLANLRALPEIFDAKIDQLNEVGITKEAVESYKNNELVSNKHIKTRGDLLLMSLSWEFDFNFSSTEKFFYNEGTREWMKRELALAGVRV